MFKKLIIENMICHQDFSDFCEDYDAKNYMGIQRLFVLPYFTKHFGYDDLNEFLTKDQSTAVQVMAAFKEVVVNMFGEGAKGPNSEISDDPRWDLGTPEAKELAHEIIENIKSKIAASSVAE